MTLLGVNIDFQLSFTEHIPEKFVRKPPSQQLPVLKRLGRILTKHGKMTIFKSFIMSNFNYCPVASHFCTQFSTNNMEKIQERALGFTFDDFESPLPDLLD